MQLQLSDKNIFLNPSTVQTAVLVWLMKDRRWKLLIKKWGWLAVCTQNMRWQRCWCFQSHHAGCDYESHQQYQLDPAAIWALTSGRWFSARRASACMKGSSSCAAYQSADPWTLLSTSLWKWRVNMTKATACLSCREPPSKTCRIHPKDCGWHQNGIMFTFQRPTTTPDSSR